ncbi:sn-glycerol-3-phosphate ABC transporter ATP-binding protein UgpC [Neorhizobium sp. T786]|uniref:ABC transporter ATP-binding protein n=1 Tax=Pseudorhizobium xiangyangii TaxID=2883104 RepID=UPI001CFFC538|nr:sn-glycerol-3-phosphate ABC transporter ATP-binding protein UgpC [Neorhizobium xiangyangii]MCB5205412.1 sn-glycerol-3-phosphate ABC transporter ATP-binding protein UgpC [Neorhizobium xiangyangii]
MNSAVGLNSISKSFGAVKIIENLSLDIPKGEFCVLVGPSGCGKSTLLRMIAGLEDTTSGDVLIEGSDVTHASARNRDIAMVFQNYALYPHMTVAENMSFSMRLKKSSKTEIDKAVKHAADILSLSSLLDRYPRQLSGGQRQRVAMGRAMVRNPKVFLFDEPLSNLDANLRVQMRSEIRDLHNRLGATTVYVTHDQVEAMTMADKIVVMRGGAIEQVGSPTELYDAPANTFVAKFMGSPMMNLIEGEIAQDDDSVFLTKAGDRVKVRSRGQQTRGRPHLLGFRSEHCEITADNVNAISLKVFSTEFTGADTLIIAKAEGQNVIVSLKERTRVKKGDNIMISPSAGLEHLFDKSTGNALPVAN